MPTNLHLGMLLALALTGLNPCPAQTGSRLTPDSSSLLLGLSSSSFIFLHLLHNPLFMLGNDQHTNPVVHHQSSLIVLLIVVVVLNRTRWDCETSDGFSTVVPS